ncbi:hypothetical protein Mmc1_0274 [Magnetococcus marinus MC-1]|uniref:Uncharacterized protein n=1 Tax=Magnetococcus marinus (strain ATCC BAA-1437 / JCM 17883 / MC-1) TaxID=156889 RepID=A0L4A8_MAGMM|nr:hypothetical protein [Magnetococcus marinus]ABK42801.1 hypothetical protein Mmc1_0274 [Magnetococcus marinus MC-1]
MSRIPIHYKVTLFYALFGVLWIFVSDRVLEFLVSDAQLMGIIQTFKGWIYVVLTSAMLFVIIRMDHLAIEKKEREKAQLYQATMSAVHHILHNFLNKMMLYRLGVEEQQPVNPELQALYERVIEETQHEIYLLQTAKQFTAEEVRATVQPK